MQNCELKKPSVFMDNFCLDGQISALWILLCAAMDFLAEFFGGRFSVAFAVHTTKLRGTIRWKNSVKTFRFAVRFLVRFFGTFFGAFFR